ncbi:MAG: hypothetical protein ACM3YO_02165 [Bacteroidota bacterium]
MKTAKIAKIIGRALGRTLLYALTLFIAWALASRLVGVRSPGNPQEALKKVEGLLWLCLSNGALFAYLVERTRWRGWKLFGGVFLLHYGIQTFMSQIETVAFNGALHIPAREIGSFFLTGLIVSLLFAPVVALTGPRTNEEANSTGWNAILWKIACLAPFYLFVYCFFGYFVAWQWVDARLFYSGSAEMLSFFGQWGKSFQEMPFLPFFQVLRGLMWAGLGFLGVRMTRAKGWEASLQVGLTMGLLLATPLFIPNPYMPDGVRVAHFWELTSSMIYFGWVAAWLFLRAPKREAVLSPT